MTQLISVDLKPFPTEVKIQLPAFSIVLRISRSAVSATEAGANRFTAIPIASSLALRQQSDVPRKQIAFGMSCAWVEIGGSILRSILSMYYLVWNYFVSAAENFDVCVRFIGANCDSEYRSYTDHLAGEALVQDFTSKGPRSTCGWWRCWLNSNVSGSIHDPGEDI